MELVEHELKTPIGVLRVALTGNVVRRAVFADRNATSIASDTPDRSGVMRRLEAYFEGDRAALDAIEVSASGTPFQSKVWAALRTIPVGTTMSYGELARLVGAPIGASRAVGSANRVNPIALIVPCHRVIGANGTLTGYAGGLDRKEWLLAHEGALLVAQPRSATNHFGTLGAT